MGASVSVGVTVGISSVLFVTLILIVIGIRHWITKKQKPDDNRPSGSGKAFRRQRRRRDSLGGSISSNDSTIIFPDSSPNNDGIMEYQDGEQEVEPYIGTPSIL